LRPSMAWSCARNEELVIPREVERLREYQAKNRLVAEGGEKWGTRVDGNDLFAPEISHDTVGAVALDRDGQHCGGYFYRRDFE
jgi:isoaspartyl peptidase/L-asparaginase-like protein (Ntn-hydrolase superfamily)